MAENMVLFLKRMARAGAAGYVMYYFSECLFWTRPTETFLGGYVVGWLLYTFLTFVLFTVVRRFRVRSLGALFLAGSVYGWLIEGVIMQTMYDAFPWQLSFTGLSWHALITVMIGWFYTRSVLFENRPVKTLLLACGLGVFYALWSFNAWIQTGEVTSLSVYAAFAFISTSLLVISYAVLDKLPVPISQPGRWEIAGPAVLLGVYYVGVTVVSRPISLVILPPLLILTYLALRRNRQTETCPNRLITLQGEVTWWNYPLLLTLPIVATLWYALALGADLMAYTDVISLIPMGIYAGTAILGAFLFGFSWWRVWRSGF